jgi:hypothetical protein
MQAPQQNSPGQTFDERVDSKSDQRNAASKYARTDSNSRLGQIPAEREVLQLSARTKLLLPIIGFTV